MYFHRGGGGGGGGVICERYLQRCAECGTDLCEEMVFKDR